MTKVKSGFTIVELVIVLLVIGILSAVVYVAYNGAQEKARNAQTASAAKAYKEAFSLYRLQNNAYPEPTTPGNRVCLGNSYPSSQCWFGAGVVDTTFMSNLQAVTGGTLPMPALPNSSNLKGIMYISSSLGNRIDGSSYANATPVAFLVYGVEGSSTRCPVGPVASRPTSNVNWFSSTPPTNNQTFAASGSNPAQCWVPLPYK